MRLTSAFDPGDTGRSAPWTPIACHTFRPTAMTNLPMAVSLKTPGEWLIVNRRGPAGCTNTQATSCRATKFTRLGGQNLNAPVRCMESQQVASFQKATQSPIPKKTGQSRMFTRRTGTGIAIILAVRSQTNRMLPCLNSVSYSDIHFVCCVS